MHQHLTPPVLEIRHQAHMNLIYFGKLSCYMMEHQLKRSHLPPGYQRAQHTYTLLRNIISIYQRGRSSLRPLSVGEVHER